MTRRTPILGLLALLLAAPTSAEVDVSYRFPLANFSGPVPSIWARLAVDREHNEVYALNPRGHDIRVFNDHGMEIFFFGEGFGGAADLTIGDDGDIYLLARARETSTLQRLNYRGDFVAEIPLRNVPSEYSRFVADRVLYRHGSLYLLDPDRMLAIAVDQSGYFQRAYDLGVIVRAVANSDARRVRAQQPLENVDRIAQLLEYTDITGFTVDARGNLFFTVATLFSGFKLSPDGEYRVFGRAGSAQGKFGVASGITVDDAGYVYVADKLRSAVLVFDPDLEFQTEFGYRGDRPSNLIAPANLAIDTSGNLYVGQAANRGVSVFRVVHETASPSQGIDTDSSVSEGPAQITEEEFLAARADFIPDQETDPSEDNRR